MADDITAAWRDLIAEFEAFLIASNMGARSVDLRVSYVERFARGRTDAPADVEPRDIIKFLGRPGWKSSTRAVAQYGVKAFFKWAKKYNHVPTDPTAAVSPIKQVRAVAAEAATPAQIAEAIKSATDPRVRLMVRLMADAGLSALEISQARPRDLSERNGDTYLRVFGRANAEREVLLLPDLVREIRACTTEWLFVGRVDGHITPAYISRMVSKVLPKGVTSEDLRLAHRLRTGGSISGRGWRDGKAQHSPAELAFMENPDLENSIALQQHISRIDRDLERDPAGAIGACKELLETLFKLVLDAEGIAYAQGRPETFPQLFALVSDALGFPTLSVPGNPAASQGVGNIADALALLALGITQTRNKIGTGHGQKELHAEQRHARLVFNSTVALAEFISDTWKAR